VLSFRPSQVLKSALNEVPTPGPVASGSGLKRG
jgi:hypothetical protein